jgi:hypothetical protein
MAFFATGAALPAQTLRQGAIQAHSLRDPTRAWGQ